MVIKIDDLTDPRVSKFTIQKDKTLARDQEILVDSPKVVLRMISAGHEPTAILANRSFIDQNYDLIQQLSGCQVFWAENQLLEGIVGHKLHHGVIALSKRPQSLELEELGDKILILNGVNKAENVGTIIRTCDAFGVESIIADSQSLSPYIRRAIRVSMGSVFKIKARIGHPLQEDLLNLRQRGYEIFGTGNYDHSAEIGSMTFPQKSALIIGSEGFGMDEQTRASCDQILRIPIRDHVDSLNASVAAGILIHHFC